MKLIEKYSSAIIACAFLLVILGGIAGFKLPNSLLPTIDRPQISLVTSWPGKTASEIEQALVAPLEQELSGLGYLKELQTTVSNGSAGTTMTFHSNANMEQVYIDVLSRISQVPNWPAQVAIPRVFNYSNGAGATLASFFLYSDREASEADLIQAYKSHVQPAFAKIPGIESLLAPTTPIEQRVDIEFDPAKLAQHSITIEQVLVRLNDMVDRSGGTLKVGSQEYGLHFKGQVPLADMQDMPISSSGPQILRLGDIASVRTRLVSDWNYFALEGKRSFYFYIQPAKNINVLETIDRIKQVTGELNDGALSKLGMKVAISRDDSRGIRNSLMLVYGNLLAGVLLACAVLYWFLRDLRVVFLIFISIPVCLAPVILAMYAGGRSMNVISLAGMALSIGLLVDAAIIVIDNIQRLRHEGLSLLPSIRQGTYEVAGALVSSTISSIIVFVPILAMQSTAGQLFKDLAFTISSSLLVSILFALVLLPILARYVLKGGAEKPGTGAPEKTSRALNAAIKLSLLPATRKPLAYAGVILGVPIAILITYLAMPPIDVLPNPKQPMVSTSINFEAPMAADVVEREIAKVILDKIEREAGPHKASIVTHGIMCYPMMCNLYFYMQGDWNFDDFKAWVEGKIVNDMVGTRISTNQGGLLQFAMPNSRVSQLDLKGAELPVLQRVGADLLEHLRSKFPKAQIEEGTALTNRATRIEFEPNQDQLIHVGLSVREFNRQLVALTDGIYLGNFYTGTSTLPFYFKAKDPLHLEQLLSTEIMVPNYGLIPLRDLTVAKMALAPESILRVNREVSISLNLTPPEDMAVGDFVAQVGDSVDGFMKNVGDDRLHVQFRGSANELKIFLGEFLQIFIGALIALAILMWFTLKSGRLAMAVLLSIPLSLAGGMLSLKLLNLFVPQNLDVITMIGFVMLMGLVVNNTILMVSHFQVAMNKGLGQLEAIRDAVSLRIRPIIMTTVICIFANLPLVLSPGDSAAIYRGLAAVNTGGMIFSALFVFAFMSALLSLPLFKLRKTSRRPLVHDEPALDTAA